MDDQRALANILAIIGRLCRENPFDGGVGELCGKLALLGGARGLALFEVHDDTDLELIGAYGLPADYVRRFPPGERRPHGHAPGDLRDALRLGRPLLVDGIAEDPRTVSLTSVAQQGRFTVSVSVPLRFDERTVGLVHAFYGNAAAAGRGELLSRVVPIVGSALAHRHLRARLDKLTDGELPPGLPGSLYPRALFIRQMQHVHAAADRYDMPYSTAAYQLDRVRALDAQYGAGLVDRALTQLAQFVLDECRRADQAGLLDRSSCAVILPGTSQQGAFTQCERVIQRFGRYPFKYGDERLQLSVSAGLSAFPANGALDADAALRSALAALDDARGADDERVVAIAAVGSAAPDYLGDLTD